MGDNYHSLHYDGKFLEQIGNVRLKLLHNYFVRPQFTYSQCYIIYYSVNLQ
jgi:hypothetical protein